MACADIWAMCGGRNNSGNTEFGFGFNRTVNNDQLRRRRIGMEFEPNWTKRIKSSAFTAEVICYATSFMPWSRKIPITDGFHEFL
ncbi:hypothetical protein NMG60_11024730 [Bertholletia excelsa]